MAFVALASNTSVNSIALVTNIPSTVCLNRQLCDDTMLVSFCQAYIIRIFAYQKSVGRIHSLSHKTRLLAT